MLQWGCISQGWYPKVIARWYQGLIGSKQLKISCFWWYFYNFVHFSCLWCLETYLDSNTDLYENISKHYRIIIKGPEGLYPIDTTTWWHGWGLGFIEESAQGFCEAAKTSYYHQFFVDNLTLLWPWDDLIIWSERDYRKTAKTKYFIPRSWQCQI